MLRKIVSYSYFRSPTSVYEQVSRGKKRGFQFAQFMPMLVRAHHAIWSGFEMRIHHDKSVRALPYWPVLEELHARGKLALVDCGDAEALCCSMLWRLKPAFEEEDAIVVCRDVDSVPMPRDRRAVEEWMASGHAVHCIHSANAHSGVMGGTTAVRSRLFRELTGCCTLEQFIQRGIGIDFSKHGADQDLLNRHLPLFAKQTLVHELDHNVGDMGPVEVRRWISDQLAGYLPAAVLVFEPQLDALCKIIGGCEEPLPAFDAYDALKLPEGGVIREVEKSAGVDARGLMEEIARL
jgi:hypothetical protein